MKITMYSILLSWLFLACSKTNDAPPVVPPPPVDDTPAQYGVPFANVPAPADAVIYQVNMRAFSASGNFQGVIARLDSIKALGANVVYLMPIYPVGSLKGVNSPYCIKDYNAVNTEFGTLDDLRALVDGAHTRNMSVILDWVANHTAWDNPWITAHKDWYLQDAGGNVVSPPNMGWNDVAQLNFSNAAMRLEMIKAMKGWVYKANVDGFRCDYTDGPPLDFWKQAIDTLRNIKTHKLLLMAEGSRALNYTVGFDYNFGFGFFGQLKAIYEQKKSVLTIDSLNQAEYANAISGQQIIRYTTNHDVNGSDGTPQELFGGDRGAMTAFVITATMKSVPMIYNGQEVGMASRIPFPFTSVKVDWTKNAATTAEYKKIIALRNTSAAIRRGVVTSYSTGDLCAYTKVLNNEKVLVIANLRNSAQTYTVPTAIAGSYKEAFGGNTVNVSGALNLAPYEYRILQAQ
ncbi:alpha-amylase family glycosyl hydrolase [Paraflavitalea pollutisoli]|uniref:alpha-amylase family glycosyl hydrolase n=1 Tax=Paraflavitalea pollutisoli TaxID=3034143 RepID=UPI0023EC8B6B|nr:alpha-amylase family glycosyl hydrolase [Paraflavitalea sp. H1-2-19X]